MCIDLVEDLYEHCRLYVYDKYGWEHESDGGYGKGYDLVKTEFLSTMKRLKALGYQIIYISKEAVSEVTLKNGNKLTSYKPNIGDKVANVLAGTVDLTIRAYMKGEERVIQLAKDENIFGGGRFNFKVKTCKLDMKDFTEALVGAQELVGHVINKVDESKEEKPAEGNRRRTKKEENTEDAEKLEKIQMSSMYGEVAEDVTQENELKNDIKEEVVNEDKPSEENKPRRRRTRKSE